MSVDQRCTTSARRGIGIVVPFDFQVDHDLWAYVPDDGAVTLHLTRTPAVHDLPVSRALAQQVSELGVVADAASRLTAVTDAVVYGCTSGSFVHGSHGEQALCDAIINVGARVSATTSGAARDALGAISARRISLVSPYVDELTELLVDFLSESQVETVRAISMGLSGDIHRVSPRELSDMIIAADTPEADAIFVSCTSLETFDLIEPLERKLGKPVLTANQVTIWRALLMVDGSASSAASRQLLFSR